MTEREEKLKNTNYLKNFTWPVILISSGTTLLLNNLGIVDWSVWNVILRFWPILLILAGIEHMFGKTFVGNIFTFIISLILVSFVFIFSISRVNRGFDQFLGIRYPYWTELKKVLPERSLREKPFGCSLWDKNCYKFVR